MEFGVGSILEGKVTGITKFGAFVSLPENKSGLVHISEIAYSYVSDVKDHLKEGQEVKVKVIGIDENGRINLSIKKAMDPPPRPAGGSRSGGRPSGAPRWRRIPPCGSSGAHFFRGPAQAVHAGFGQQTLRAALHGQAGFPPRRPKVKNISRSGAAGAGYFVSGSLLTAPGTWPERPPCPHARPR